MDTSNKTQRAKVNGVGFTINEYGVLVDCDDWETVTCEPDGKHHWYGTHRDLFDARRIGNQWCWKATPAFYAILAR